MGVTAQAVIARLGSGEATSAFPKIQSYLQRFEKVEACIQAASDIGAFTKASQRPYREKRAEKAVPRLWPGGPWLACPSLTFYFRPRLDSLFIVCFGRFCRVCCDSLQKHWRCLAHYGGNPEQVYRVHDFIRMSCDFFGGMSLGQ